MGDWEKAAEMGRVERCAESFRRLAEVFCQLPSKKETLDQEDLQEIYEAARENVCVDCGRFGECWGTGAERTAHMVYDLLSVTAREEGAGEEVFRLHVQERFLRYCIRGNAFAEELKNCFYRARLNLLWSNRLLENRAALACQLEETAGILREVACTVFEAGEPDRALEKKIRGRLRLRHIRVRDLRLLKRDWRHPELILTANAAKGHCVTVREVASVLSEACESPLVAERNSRLTLGHEPATLHFVEETHYYMLTGAAREACPGQPACGDNFAVLTGSHGQVVLGISDGMGSGAAASRESQMVIELLEQFLNAGFSAETAVKMINSTMVLRRGMRTFSTLDICRVSLYSGQCEFLKVGAATTFIRRKDGVDTVSCTSLPVGVFQEADLERARVCLESGDMVVMVSDGVLDALPRDGGEELLKRLILQTTAENPTEFAGKLLKQVKDSGAGPRDDMTVLAGGFWRK